MRKKKSTLISRGRQMYYKTPEALKAAVDNYFNSCEGELIFDTEGCPVMDKSGYPKYRNRRPMTMTGLALYLGFTSRRALLNYKYRPEYSLIYQQALLKCEEYAETMLFTRDGYAGAVYTLRQCYGWDKKPNDPPLASVTIIVNPTESSDHDEDNDTNADTDSEIHKIALHSLPINLCK